MLLRKLLIQFLVLSLMFGAMVVAPMHAASELQQAGQSAASAVSHNNADEAAQHEPEVHGACAWCLAASLQPFDAGSGSALMSVACIKYAAERPALLAQMPLKANPHRWPFSSRDPPHP